MGSAEKEDYGEELSPPSLAAAARELNAFDGDESEVSPLSTLTPREVQVLNLLTEGHTNRCVFLLLLSGSSTACVCTSYVFFQDVKTYTVELPCKTTIILSEG